MRFNKGKDVAVGLHKSVLSGKKGLSAPVMSLVLLGTLLILLTACASGGQVLPPTQVITPTQVTAPTPAAVTVRVGYLTGDLHQMSHIVAQEPAVANGRSLYEQNGLTIENATGAPYANGGVEMDHFASGDVDIGLLGLSPVIIKSLNAGVDTIVVGQVNKIGSALVVANDINRFTDLAGKTVATPGRSTIQFFLLLNLVEKEGLDLSRLTVVDMAPKDMRAALEKGNIAGYIAWEPFVSDAVVSGAGKILATSQNIWPDHPCCVVVANRDFAKHNPEILQRFLLAHGAATQWINNALARPDSKEYNLLVDLGVTFTGRDAAVVKEAFNNIDYQAGVDSSFQQSFIQFTQKLLEFNVVPPEKLQERGYQNVDDFAVGCIQPAFPEEVK